MQKNGSIWPLATVANCLLVLGVLIFAKGFFPYKPFVPGLGTYSEGSNPPPAPFDKLILMVVDSLRSDFVFSDRSGFLSTQELIRAGRALPFTAHANAPTITMPRVKAITTGSVPGFLDVILNFAESDTTSTLVQQDTWLAQLRSYGKKLVMYGDDTWLKLFPDMFTRADGTSSFFVSDFTEVDNNVTRHVDPELSRDDWGVMILHYLGLDHIGHKTGPRSPHMIPKQTEMDTIVRRIYAAMEQLPHLQSALLVLLGDHGMNDAGNHGGSGPGETSPALVFVSPRLHKVVDPGRRLAPVSPVGDDFDFYRRIGQSDLAPTLAGLLGVPVPRNNLGVFIPEMLNMWDPQERVELLMENAKQLMSLASLAYPSCTSAVAVDGCESLQPDIELACRWQRANEAYSALHSDQSSDAQSTIDLLFEFSSRCQSILSRAASNYDLRLMTTGVIMVLAATAISGALLVSKYKTPPLGSSIFLLMTSAYGVMMFASSYVEEEHHFWYWAGSGWLCLLFITERRTNRPGFHSVIALLLFRLSRRWNQTGQKHAGAPDIARTYFPAHTTFMWSLVLATYAYYFLRIAKHSLRRVGLNSLARLVFAVALVSVALGFKLSFAAQDSPELIPSWLNILVEFLDEVPLVLQARATIAMIFAGLAFTLIDAVGGQRLSTSGTPVTTIINDFLGLFLATQTRTSNIPLLLLNHLINELIHPAATLGVSELTLTVLIFQHASFYAFGGANAISSVDLSNAYNGVSGYNVLVVGALTFISNWIGPIYWASVALESCASRSGPHQSPAREGYILMTTTFYAIAASFIMLSCTALRTHLFIWTVFSPKYLFSMVWAILYHICIDIGWGALMNRAALSYI